MKVKKIIKKRLADTVTPVNLYLNIREKYSNSILLEGADFHGEEDSHSFICFNPVACFSVENNIITENYTYKDSTTKKIKDRKDVIIKLNSFIKQFSVDTSSEISKVDGVFGYSAYNAEKYFENIEIAENPSESYKIPEIHYCFYRYIIIFNHYRNELFIQENLIEGEKETISSIEILLNNLKNTTKSFRLVNEENSNFSDQQYMDIVSKGKQHCRLGDVFQIVLSRQFSQQYSGDDFNVYRALRYINPSPYLYYFDYGNFRIMGSSPEAQIKVNNEKVTINPIAGTFKRTGNAKKDSKLAEELKRDPKENAEHVMLVDLARNDISRNCRNVEVETYKEIQYFSHVIHMVSKVSGKLKDNSNTIKVLADTFPAGTLSGAPKYKAMQLIDKYENQDRSFYGGGIGFIGFNGDINHAIMIRSFLSKERTMFYQAGAGVVEKSEEINELNEVNNKLAALKKALKLAEEI